MFVNNLLLKNNRQLSLKKINYNFLFRYLLNACVFYSRQLMGILGINYQLYASVNSNYDNIFLLVLLRKGD